MNIKESTRTVLAKSLGSVKPLTDAIASAQWSRSNVLLTVGVIAFVILMFFIPELIDLQRGTEPIAKAPVAQITADQSATGAPSEHPLAEISRMLDRKDLGAAARASYKFSNDPSIPSDRVLSPEEIVDVKARQSAQLALSDRPLTWERFKEPATAKALASARDGAIELLKEIKENDESTRFALVNFINGVRSVEMQERKPQLRQIQELRDVGVSAEGAYSYLETLDMAVTRSMVKEGVDRSVYKKWQQVSLGPLFETSRMAREKLEYEVPFKPVMSLDRVIVYRPGPSYRPDGRVYANIWAFVKGSDIDRIDIYEDGVFRQRVALSAPDRDGFRKFRLIQRDAKKVFTFVAHDKFGATYEKSYQFYPRVQRFQWTPKNAGRYLISLPSGFASPALDQFFRYHGGLRSGTNMASAPNTGYVTF